MTCRRPASRRWAHRVIGSCDLTLIRPGGHDAVCARVYSGSPTTMHRVVRALGSHPVGLRESDPVAEMIQPPHLERTVLRSAPKAAARRDARQLALTKVSPESRHGNAVGGPG